MASARSDADEYAIRLATPRDRGRFLDLYEDVWGTRKSAAWFDWRFRENPHADGVEMVVAERGGELVGAEPLLPFALTVGEETVPVRQPVDWIVHPDHRRQGVFTRMTERLLSAYADRGALLFNFPSEALRPGLQRFDWTELGSLPTRYRVQHPENLLAADGDTDTRTARLGAQAMAPVMRTALAATDALTSGSSVPVERIPGVGTRSITAVYRDTAPASIHVPRTPAHVNWRYANPRWNTTTYVAHEAREPRATVVAAAEPDASPTSTHILDVQPMTTRPDRAPAVAAALDAALRDHRDADCVVAAGGPFPRVFRRRGFLSDHAPLLSRAASPTTHVVRPLGDAQSRTFDADVFDPENWVLALGDRDVD